MKSVGTINEILDLFYNRIDNISIHTKYTAEKSKYGYELKDGILYRRGKQISVCNKFVPFVIILTILKTIFIDHLSNLKIKRFEVKLM